MEIFADRSKISQVLRNFISNALKFTPSGGHVRVVQKFFPSVNSTTDNTIPLENKPNTLSSIMKEVVRSRTVSSAVFVTNVEDDPESGTGTNGILRIEVHDTGHGISKVTRSID